MDIPLHQSLAFVDRLEKEGRVLLGFDGFVVLGNGVLQPLNRIADFTSNAFPDWKVSEKERYELARKIIRSWIDDPEYKLSYIEFVTV